MSFNELYLMQEPVLKIFDGGGQVCHIIVASQSPQFHHKNLIARSYHHAN